MSGNFKLALGTYLVMLTFAALFTAGNALGLPCNGQAVNTGDTMEEVAAKCGEAMLKEQWQVKVEETDKNGTRSVTTTTFDEWAFDFGPEELMQSYRFENGKLVEIGSIGYGRPHEETADTCRNGELLAVGDSYLDAFLKCGEPIAKEKQAEKVSETTDGEKKRLISVPVVEWIYRYGPDAPGYTLRLENGRITDIRTREFGK